MSLVRRNWTVANLFVVDLARNKARRRAFGVWTPMEEWRTERSDRQRRAHAMVVAALAGLAISGVVAAQDAMDAAEDSPTLRVEDAVAAQAIALVRAPGSVVARDGVLNLRVGDVAVAELVDVLGGIREGKANLDARRPHVLVTRGVLTPAERSALDGLGVRRMGYLPSNAWIVDLSAMGAQTLEALAKVDFVVALTPYLDAWKVDPWLAAGAHARVWQTPSRRELAARDGDQGGRVAATVHAFANQPLDAVLDALRGVASVEVYSSERVLDNWTVSISLASRHVADLAGLVPVQFAEMTGEYVQRSNATTRWVVQSNVLNQTPLHARGLMGQGQIVAFMDLGMAWEHCSFSDPGVAIGPTHRKLAAYNAPLTYDLHGSHVAGTLAGDAGTVGNTRGIAYLSRIVFNTLPTFEEASHISRYALHMNQGAFVHSNSWGANFVTEYDGGSRAIDAFTWENDDALICFSVANQATVANPENSKNCLAVSLTANAPDQSQMPCGGASGPTIDGRRKPELVAPGCSITSSAGSSSGSCGTTTRTGTSMAQPAVAAIGVLARQYFVEGFYPSGVANPSDALFPSGALLKAVLVASGQDVTGVPGYPNMREGFGRVLADSALHFAGDPTRLIVQQAFNQSSDALDQDGDIVHRFEVDDATLPVRVILAWQDYPATIGASFAPVNNLDLVVVGPDGKSYYGNAFDAQGESIAVDQGATRDAINNTEGVIVSQPATGEWTVRIEGRGVNAAGQGYGLAITGGVTEIEGGDCIADFDQDGGITGADISAFMDCYQQGLPRADLDQNGGIDPGDVAEFFYHYERGC